MFSTKDQIQVEGTDVHLVSYVLFAAALILNCHWLPFMFCFYLKSIHIYCSFTALAGMSVARSVAVTLLLMWYH